MFLIGDLTPQTGEHEATSRPAVVPEKESLRLLSDNPPQPVLIAEPLTWCLQRQ